MQTGAAYIRVSTEDQIEFSPDSQIKKIKEYAALHDIFLPEEFIFIDEGISGRHAENRPAFMKMIGMSKAKPRPFDIVLVWKFSRFARSREDSIFYKTMLRRDQGIDVVSISEQLSNDKTSILVESLLEAMDEYYSINLAEEVKRGMNEKFSRGGIVSVPPFGYKAENGHYVIYEEQAPIIRMIFEDFANGLPYRQIATKLNDMGIRSNRGNLFENRTIEYILSNPTYLGKLRRNLNGKDTKDRYHRSDDVMIVDSEHEPIITEDLYQKVQTRIEDIKKSYQPHARTANAPIMLAGLVRCSNCGATLAQATRGTSLQCHRYARGQCDKSHNISLKKINKAVLDQLTADLGNLSLSITVSDPKDTTSTDVTEIALKQEYKKLERVRTAYEAGVDSLEEYRLYKTSIMERIRELEKKLEKPVLTQEKIAQTFQIRLRDALPKLNSPDISEADKNKILRSFISKIVFSRPENTIKIYYYI